MDSRSHVTIVGSDVAGLVSAILLAEKGVQVAVIKGRMSHGVYQKSGYIFDEEPFMISGPDHGPIGTLFREAGISLDKLKKPPLSFQVVLPDERIDVSRNQHLFYSELERCFPGESSQAIAFYGLLSQARSQLSWAVDMNPFSFRPFLPSVIKKGRKSLSSLLDSSGLNSNRFLAFIKAQISVFTYLSGDVSILAASSLLESNREGICYIEGGKDALSELLMKKISELGGNIMEMTPVGIARDQNGWLIKTTEKLLYSQLVIGNMNLDAFCSLFAEKRRRYCKKADSIEKVSLPFTMNLGVKAAGVPAGMADNVIMLRDYKKEPARENIIYIRIGSEAEGKRSLSASCLIPRAEYQNRQRLNEIAESVLEGVAWLCPFIDRHTDVVDVRYSEPQGYPVFKADARQRMGIGLLPHEIAAKSLYYAGPEVFPALGFDGLIYSGELAAISAYKALEGSR